MKKSKLFHLVLTLNLVFCFGVFAQNITITDDDAYTPDNAAILDVKSTSKGVLLPRLTDEQRDALYRDVPQGMLIFNTTDSAFQVYIDTSWHPMSMGTPEIAPKPLTDYDGNVYQTITIGNQNWMAENLRTTHYADGTALVDGAAAGGISGDYTTKYYFWYNNDSTTNADTYGALYTWAAIMNASASSSDNPSGVQGVCPDGWHLPSDVEWKELEMYLGMSQADADNTGWRGTNEGSKLAGNSGLWNDGTLENDAEFGTSGFLALPGGYRGYNGTFPNLGYGASFWSATELNSSIAWYRTLYYNTSGVYRDIDSKNNGFSARCVQD